MIIVSFLMIFGPAVVTWKICDMAGVKQSEKTVNLLLGLLLDCLLIFIASYIVSNILYGRIPMSFSPTYYPEIEKNIYHVSFTWKYGILSSFIAAVWALIKIYYPKVKVILERYIRK